MSTGAAGGAGERATARDAGVDYWASTLDRWLPLLSLVAPLFLFLSAVVRASGAGLLPGALFWISTHEAPIAGFGAWALLSTVAVPAERSCNDFEIQYD